VQKLKEVFNLPDACSLRSVSSSTTNILINMESCSFRSKFGNANIYVEWPESVELIPSSDMSLVSLDFNKGANITFVDNGGLINEDLSGSLAQLELENDDVYASVGQYCYHSSVPKAFEE